MKPLSNIFATYYDHLNSVFFYDETFLGELGTWILRVQHSSLSSDPHCSSVPPQQSGFLILLSFRCCLRLCLQLLCPLFFFLVSFPTSEIKRLLKTKYPAPGQGARYQPAPLSPWVNLSQNINGVSRTMVRAYFLRLWRGAHQDMETLGKLNHNKMLKQPKRSMLPIKYMYIMVRNRRKTLLLQHAFFTVVKPFQDHADVIVTFLAMSYRQHVNHSNWNFFCRPITPNKQCFASVTSDDQWRQKPRTQSGSYAIFGCR